MNSPDDEIKSIENLLSANGYLPNYNIAITVFLSLKLKKPILIEGPPGTGKTELSKAVGKALNKDFFRIQCYEGITFEAQGGRLDDVQGDVVGGAEPLSEAAGDGG